jgi:Fic family protein
MGWIDSPNSVIHPSFIVIHRLNTQKCFSAKDFQKIYRRGRMDYSDYSFSATTHAEFFKAESELIRLGERFVNIPSAKYMRTTLLAIDAVFAIRISRDIVLPVVPLIVAFDQSEWRHSNVGENDRREHWLVSHFSKSAFKESMEALHYMQAIQWVATNTHTETVISIDTVLHLHEILLSGETGADRYHGFRKSFLPYKKGTDPSNISFEIMDLCRFINTDCFSPIGQATVIHHAFESIVPFESLIDRTGLALAFMSMFRRGVFTDGYMVPICWGASLEKEYRRKLRDSSRHMPSTETYLRYRERWAAYNARNTHLSVVIAKSFLSAAERLRLKWRSQVLRIPSSSALDKLLDLFLAVPNLSTTRASKIIGKSYGATNEAMRQMVKAGIIKEVALDGRERVFVCEQSASMITEFVEDLGNVEDLGKMGDRDEASKEINTTR